MILELVLIHVQLITHFTFGLQQVSKLFHDFTTGSYQIQTYANILPLFSKQLHNLFQHFHWLATVVPHISAAYRGCSSIFSTPRIGFHQFFSSLLCLINFHHCVIVFFSLFIFSHVHFVHRLLSFLHCLYIVFIAIYFSINFDHVYLFYS